MNYGDIVQLGRHRLMCGDATDYGDIQRLLGGEHPDLVLTDPPYGVKTHGSYRFGGNKRGYNTASITETVMGDKNTDTARKHYNLIASLPSIIWGAQYFTDFLPPQKGWLVWHKEQKLYNHADCELAWTNLHTPAKYYSQLWSGYCRAGNKSLNPCPHVHPTQKPVELHARILEDFSQEGDLILDCFGGSGTTLIACEITGRRCFMMELSPQYCDVIINRYNTLTEGGIFS